MANSYLCLYLAENRLNVLSFIRTKGPGIYSFYPVFLV